MKGQGALQSSALATSLITIICRLATLPSRRLPYTFLMALRRLLILVWDPPVTLRIGATDLLLPLSHDGPIFLSKYPTYSRNLVRLSDSLSEHLRRALVIVDVGANVGDSVALLNQNATHDSLCIDGDKTFLPYLLRNLGQIAGRHEVAEAYLDFEARTVMRSVEMRRGTARLIPGSDPLAVQTLQQVVEDHPRFLRPDLVKIDTDGMDVQILRGAADFLKTTQPVIFFEYDPGAGGGSELPTLAAELAESHYGYMLAYDNLGFFISSGQLNDPDYVAKLDDISARLGQKSEYLDLAVLPRRHARWPAAFALAEEGSSDSRTR